MSNKKLTPHQNKRADMHASTNLKAGEKGLQ